MMELWYLEDEEAKVTMIGFTVGFAVLKMAEVRWTLCRPIFGCFLIR